MTGHHVNEQLSHLVPVSVEILLLRADPAGAWRYRRIVTSLDRGENPDQAVRRAGGLTAEATSTVVHSTSWRYQPEGQVVLTYAVCPDPAAHLPAIALTDFQLVRGSAPSAPSPEHLQVENVVAHALRHLAFLVLTDPVVGEALTRDPALAAGFDALKRNAVPLGVAGGLRPVGER
ncbi:hypothetical protein OG884_02415 [Streptosporangium sp. NBC_01755]|uniref:hypothetical protein n=1 Tax=unclassified Streptosporangium TaxID=2632669 RepID=UPI002DDBF406|nr:MULTISPECIES: hypothetical protein [unclassified Streptosporangium]WSA27713.1 hypothetical protein OIE13_07520 [Streptosporangium sp. NBC_01810]WSD00813.1 hypothetical protein OG884_02415 [Streptosporangium sp. NBC_01755]